MPRNAYGLDISDRSAELVSLFHKRGSVAIGGFGRTEIPAGIINRGVILDPDKLVIILTRFFDAVFGQKRGRIPIGFALPESVVFAKTFPLPANFDRDLAMKALAIEAADTFPISMSEVVSDLWTVSQTKEGQDVLYAAADMHVAEAYKAVLVRAGAVPVFFDSEAMALARSLVDPAGNQPVLLVDIGARTTSFVLHDARSIQMSSSVAVGGDNLSSALEIQLNIPLEKAELLKRKAGFDPSAADGRAFLILQRPMGEIIEEITLTKEFYFRKTGRRVDRIILAGGTSLTPLIADYVESNFQGMQVKVGDPLGRISLEWLSEPESFKKKAILYATALGLAERALGDGGGPGLNLLPGARVKRNPAADAIDKLRSLGSLFSAMVTRPKKTPKKKAQPSDEEEVVVAAAAPEPAPEPAPAPPPAVPPAPPAPPAPPPQPAPVEDESIDILAGLGGDEAQKPPAPPASAPAEPPKSAAPKESSEMLDFGKGIGDFLGSTYSGHGPATDAELAGENIELPKGSGKVKIEHILKRAKGEPVPAEEEEEEETEAEMEASPAAPARPRSPRQGGSKLLMLGMVVLVIILVLAAAGGVYMFAKSNGVKGISLPKISWPFGKKAPAGEQPAPEKSVPEAVSVVFLASVDPQPAGEKPSVTARVIETDVSASDGFKATGESVASAGKAKGVITIINTTSRAYTFVATTRFLTREGVLFRMDKQTFIPANGSATTAVTADQPGPSGDVGPSEWTIPGLSANLQDDIYGKSDAPMTGGSGTVPSVTQGDLDAAKEALLDKLKGEGEKNFQVMLAPGEKILPDLITSSELSADGPKPGAAVASFTLKLTLRFRAMVIPEQPVSAFLADKLKGALPEGMSPADVELGRPQFTVEAYDTAAQRAEIRAEASVKKL